MRRGPAGHRGAVVDLSTTVGSVELSNPVMTASGTAGYGGELTRYVDVTRLGAVVVKSQAAEPWPGNPPPRVHETPAGMINSVGLQGSGVKAWRDEHLPILLDAGAKVVASIWGRTVEEYEAAAELLVDLPSGVIALEVNLSCPNLHGHDMFAQVPEAAAEAVAATMRAGLPVWAKLTAHVTSIVPVVEAVAVAGAEAVTLINTAFGLVIDVEARRPRLGAIRGGLSGPAIRPMAVRAVYDVHEARPDLPIVGVGGVATGVDAVEMLLAGASAVQVGTATFADPRAVERVRDEMEVWCRSHDVQSVRELIGGAHGR
jgi:dihydroorotate dehydrogenase (NAD+) catalytic subunit